ncbi:GNAT family N-acetyltransferase [Candidatus Tisiphia endosymbiont of Oplodontha viridula]|uniref:GNAT family N-acetyltransferase n=1 Tax=Candidatus Tisiphia endosymbiont of Oplodontha viridula TaxID=3077925 RepID=UPI0035C88506
MNIHFEKANLSHKETIFNWLKEPHVQEFWDNSQEHKDDILNFINGRIKPSSYADGLYTYWIGCIYNEPYCLVMTLQEKQEYSIPLLKKAYLSKHGHTYSMDYTIGNIAYFGKGLGAKTLEVFIDFIRSSYDSQADTFFIDPDVTNPRARHVYEKVGFKYIDDFIMEGEGVFAGRKTHFLVKRL